MKDKRAAGLLLFKSKPLKGIQLLRSSGVVPTNANGTAEWLRSNLAAVDRQSLGELLGSSDEDAIPIMHAYIDMVRALQLANCPRLLTLSSCTATLFASPAERITPMLRSPLCIS